MISYVHLINIILPFLYAITLILYYYNFVREKTTVVFSKRFFLILTLTLHVFYIILRTIEFDHTPITSKFEIFSILAFSISFSYLILELWTDIRRTGFFIIAISLIFQIVSTVFVSDNYEVPLILKDRLLGIHVMSAILGYSGFTISAVYGLLFIALYKDIKLKRFGVLFNKLPNLEILEKLSFYSVVIGFGLLSIAISIGAVWLPAAFPDFSILDPKLVSTFIVWLIFGTGISVKVLANWYGRKVITFALIGYAIAIISLIATSIFKSTFHSFY